MKKNLEDKEDSGYMKWYKKASITAGLVVTGVLGTVGVLSYMEKTVQKGVTSGITEVAQIIVKMQSDIEQSRKEIDDLRIDMEEVKKEQQEQKLLLSVLTVKVNNNTEVTQELKWNFIRPEGPETKKERKRN